MGKTSSSSQSTSYVTTSGAGASSSASTTSPSGETISQQVDVFTPGATSSRASAGASSIDGVTTGATAPAAGPSSTEDMPFEGGWSAIEHTPNLVLHIGSIFNDRFSNTDQQDVMIGHTGVDIFELSFDRRETSIRIDTVDIVVDFDVNADFLQLPDGVGVRDLSFELGDLDTDDVPDSTIIRLGQDGDILAIVLNRILPISPEQTAATGAGTPSQSVFPFFVDGTDIIDDAIATPDFTDVITTVSIPTETSDPDVSTIHGTLAIDFLLGTPSADRLVGTPDRDIFVGYGDGDVFVLDAAGTEHMAEADLILDFNGAQGDLLQLSSDLSWATDIVLEPVDLDNNGIVESTSVRLINGDILAIVRGTTDLPSNLLVDAVNPAE